MAITKMVSVVGVAVFFIGFTLARHTRMNNIGILGEPLFSFDPYSIQPSGSASSSAASSSSASSSASSSGSSGNIRTLSSATTRLQRPRTDPILSGRRRAFIANIGGRNILVVPNGQRGHSATGHNGNSGQIPIQRSLANLGIQLVGNSRTQPVLQQKQQQPVAAPPGVQFLGRVRSPLVHGGEILLQQSQGQVIPVQNQILGHHVLQPSGSILLGSQNQGHILGTHQVVQPQGNGVIVIDRLTGNVHGSGIQTGPVSATLPASPGTAAAPPPPSEIPIPNTSNLKLVGLNFRGEIIIQGPYGTITIGPEILDGIRMKRAFPANADFEELEAEMLRRSKANANQITITDPAMGSIVVNRKTGSGLKQADPSASSSAGAAAVASSSASASASAGASSSAASSASAASAQSEAASGASAQTGSATITLGNGVSINNGVITIDNDGGKTQTVSLGGGPNGQMQVADGGNGLKVAGNATFIVSG